MSRLDRRSTLVSIALVAGLAAPGAALAAPSAGEPNTVVLSGTQITATAESSKADLIRIEQESPTVVTLRTRTTATTWPDANLGAGCVFADDASGTFRRIRCTAADPITNVKVHGGDGNDLLQVLATSPTTTMVELHGGEGSDSLIGGDQADQLFGGAGSDSLRGDDGNDTMSGGEDRDTFVGGAGGDSMQGDGGFDLVDYSGTPPDQPLSISLDDAANDGAAGEGDNARSSIEDVTGGQGADEIKGSALANELNGYVGNDVIEGGGGTDSFNGSDGNDTILSRDGNPERVDCGEQLGDADADTARTDDVDAVSGCESNEAVSTAPDRDLDDDGVSAPADCDDANKGVNPAAVDAPENGVDENCDNADAVHGDRDGDGSGRDLDCDDTNPNIKPGATEAPGNAFDENCDLVASPFAAIETPVLELFEHRRGRTMVRKLGVGAVPAGTTATVRCVGGKKRGCPVDVKKKVFTSASVTGVSWTKHFRRAKLRKGAAIIVDVTRPGYIGLRVIFTMKARGVPTPRPLCLFPGEKKAREC